MKEGVRVDKHDADPPGKENPPSEPVLLDSPYNQNSFIPHKSKSASGAPCWQVAVVATCAPAATVGSS